MLNERSQKEGKKVMPPHLMLMWLNPTAIKKPMDVAKQDFNKVKIRIPGGDQSQERDKKSLAFIVASQITGRAIAGYTKEILKRVELQTKTSKKARMVPP
jgi:hypothetical protein